MFCLCIVDVCDDVYGDVILVRCCSVTAIEAEAEGHRRVRGERGETDIDTDTDRERRVSIRVDTQVGLGRCAAPQFAQSH